jgi:hypothetical protein
MPPRAIRIFSGQGTVAQKSRPCLFVSCFPCQPHATTLMCCRWETRPDMYQRCMYMLYHAIMGWEYGDLHYVMVHTTGMDRPNAYGRGRQLLEILMPSMLRNDSTSMLCPTGGDGANSVRFRSTLSLHLLFESGWGWTLLHVSVRRSH